MTNMIDVIIKMYPDAKSITVKENGFIMDGKEFEYDEEMMAMRASIE